MKFFRRAPAREEVYRIDRIESGARGLLRAMFWGWGTVGFIVIMIDLIEVFSKLKEGVGVGSSSFLAALALVWTGGMIFFGLGALLVEPGLAVSQEEPIDEYGDVRVER